MLAPPGPVSTGNTVEAEDQEVTLLQARGKTLPPGQLQRSKAKRKTPTVGLEPTTHKVKGLALCRLS